MAKVSDSRMAKSSAVFIAMNVGINYNVLKFLTWSQNRLSLLEEKRNLENDHRFLYISERANLNNRSTGRWIKCPKKCIHTLIIYVSPREWTVLSLTLQMFKLSTSSIHALLTTCNTVASSLCCWQWKGGSFYFSASCCTLQCSWFFFAHNALQSTPPVKSKRHL